MGMSRRHNRFMFAKSYRYFWFFMFTNPGPRAGGAV
jgi:hypothetical protein